MSALDDLCKWYRAQCDGDWEHTYGVVVETLDNPGWWVKVDLRDTLLEQLPFETYQSGDSDADESWIICEKKGAQFHGMGDPSRLEEIVTRFLLWAKDRADWLAVPDDSTLRARDDAELWEHLGKSRGEERCRVEGCGQFRIRLSVYCRVHHWEKVLGRPLPPGARD